MKKWYESKEIWWNIIMTLLNVMVFLNAQGYVPVELTILVQGVGNIILRVWFTNSSIERSIR